MVSVHCDWASWGLLQTFNVPCREGARGSPGPQRAPWDGDGAEEGCCTARRPPTPGVSGTLEGATACGLASLRGGLSGREALSFLPFFLSRFESSQSRI